MKFGHKINKEVDKIDQTQKQKHCRREQRSLERTGRNKRTKEGRVGWREMKGEKEITSQQRTEELIRLFKVISQRELSALISLNHVTELMSTKHSKCTL